jgi:dipeptidyl aminopeptidase/acylaminoacyl peptidase
VFGTSTYAFESADRILCAYHEKERWRLGSVDTRASVLTPIESPFTDIAYVRAGEGRAVMLAGSPTQGASIVEFNFSSGRFETVKRPSDMEIDPAYVSPAQLMQFPTENGETAYAYFYPPKNPDCTGLGAERPPLLVMSHGGPTSASGASLNPRIQFWTSRGVGVLDVNYGGSTGYGRAYRERLKRRWGIVDVDDCVNGARYLAQRGEIDGERLAIRGGSAGGYTTLAALTFRDAFTTGASYYGVSDLEVLVQDTHKFESRYLDGLVGRYPDEREVYLERSPIHFVDRLARPMILFQGLEDKVVPPNQAELMFNAVRAKGLRVAYIPFEGEQHGFRKAENIKRAFEAEFYFYSKIFKFDPADDIEPVEIENL